MELSDDHFRLLVESVEDHAIYLLERDGTVCSWNAGAQRLTGCTSSEIVGRSFAQFFSPADRERGKPDHLLEAALRSGRTEELGWRVRKDGSPFWASTVLTVLRDRDGSHLGFANVTRDLTDRSYRGFVEAAHAIVWTTDANGHPNADSPSWRAFTGQTEAEWRGLRAWEPVHPEDTGALRLAWPKAKAEGTRFEAQFRLRRQGGEYVWMEARAIPFLDPDGHVREWVGVTFDVSDRKRAELQTERALQLWTTTLRSIGDAVISTDAAGNVRFMNPVAEQLTGWTEQEASGRTLHEVFPIFNEETSTPVENPVHEVLRKGVTVGLANHTVLRRRNGVELPINDSAAPIRDPDGSIDGVVLVFRDASEEQREVMRRTFLASSTEAMIDAADYRDALAQIARRAVPCLADWATVDIADGGTPKTQQLAVAHVDPAKLAYARELERRYPPDPNAAAGVPNVMRTGRAEFYPEIPRAILEGTAVDDEHRRLLRALDPRSALVVPLRGKGPVFGAITFAYAGSARRYTPRDLELAEELARRAALIIERRWLEEQAEHANRMKDEFLATMSHELRTPLQAILGYASMLERGAMRDPAKAIAAIVRNAAAQTRLVEDILDVSRITSGKLRLSMGRVEVAAAVRAALESMRPAAMGRRIRIVESLPADLGHVRGDFERLQQIVWNLLSNAVKFTEPGGVVEIRGERIGSMVRVIVRDTGQGIPPEHLSAIFERFRQLDSSATRQRGGLGLGLSIVQYLVEAHGGTVVAQSAGPGKGATFTVSLPARLDDFVREDAAHARPPVAEARPLRGIRVLIVDDDDDTREIVAVMLSEEGASVIAAASAAEALARLQAEPPHLLISDIGMPFEDGYALLRRVRSLPPERGGDVPAIALTAYTRREDVRAVEDAGFQLHVVKPIRPEQLFDAVRSCVRGRSGDAR
jgi:PAS domain S-box-containing protein